MSSKITNWFNIGDCSNKYKGSVIKQTTEISARLSIKKRVRCSQNRERYVNNFQWLLMSVM